MTKKLAVSMLCSIFFLGMFALLPNEASAQNTSYVFRSTVTGSGIRQTGQYSYEITGEKTNFNTDESPFFLTRIFNITNVNKFQFKHELRSSGYSKDVYSPVYYPNGNWWAEIYYWSEFGKIPAGSYELITLVSVNGGNYKYERTTYFSVAGGSYYAPYTPPAEYAAYRPYERYDYYYAQPQNYTYGWTHIGKNIQKTGQYSYTIVNQTSDFNSNEDVYALAMFSNISGIDTFRIKFDVYADGNRYIKTNEVPTLWPRGQRWESNYSWANLGKLANGYYEIRTHISINGGAYVKLNTQTINVGRHYNYYDCDYRNRGDYDYYRRCGQYNDYRPTYTFEWTRLNDNIAKSGTYRYDMSDRSDMFYSDENIKALTKFSHIDNIGYFQVKLDLYYNGLFKREYLGAVQRPNKSYWEYNYTQSDLGTLSEGDYIVKTYISTDGSSFKLAGTKNFTVRAKRYSTQSSYYRPYDCRRDQYDRRDWNYAYNSECTGYYSCQTPRYYNYPY